MLNAECGARGKKKWLGSALALWVLFSDAIPGQDNPGVYGNTLVVERAGGEPDKSTGSRALPCVRSLQEGASSKVWSLGSGLFGDVPAGKHEDGGMTLQNARQGFGPFDPQIDGIVFDS